MAKKVIITAASPLPRERAERMAAQVAAHLGLEPCDVLVLPDCAVTVVDVAEKVPVATPATTPAPTPARWS